MAGQGNKRNQALREWPEGGVTVVAVLVSVLLGLAVVICAIALIWTGAA